jgi:hypothetical protein
VILGDVNWPVGQPCLLAAVLLTGGAPGCRPSGHAVSDAGTVAARSTGARAGQPLVPDAKGRVARSTTGATGIQGRWRVNADTEDCRTLGKHDARDCSRFVTPDPAAPVFAPTADLGMCATGVVAPVIVGKDGKMDYTHIWGATAHFAFEGGGFDAPGHHVTGFSFHIDAEPPPGLLRVMLLTVSRDTNAAFWGGAASEASPVHAGRNEFRWADVGGPIWLDNPPPFDPTELTEVSFMVPAVPGAARSFSFCIDRLTALLD